MRISILLGICAALSSGCATDAAQPGAKAEQVEAVGGIELSLTSTDSSGRVYRLRNANFTISPNTRWGYDAGGIPESKVLSTETDPNASQLTVRLVPGQYIVTLGGAWYIERLSPGGAERVEQVVLLTPREQQAYVGDGYTRTIEFRFGVDGEYIDFRYGDLNIDVGIELPGETGGQPPCQSYYDYYGGYYPCYYDAGTISYDAGPIFRGEDAGAPLIID